ncbi:YciI family protein [Kribbella sp. NPDC049584]|uniref:YciI family protein n=1 Tax=Kribbella sp. NPDC049584 TaxID=3154833 RepID=UPI00341E8699
MQFLVSVLDDKTNSATPEEMAAITAFNERIIADGNWVFAGGLAAPSAATVVDNRGGDAIFTDGPYLESKEYVAGLWIMEAADLDAARELVTEASKACNRRLEVRPFL